MRLIDADALEVDMRHENFLGTTLGVSLVQINNAPSIELVRCRECKHKDNCEQEVLLSEMCGEVEDTAHLTFCSYGERSRYEYRENMR